MCWPAISFQGLRVYEGHIRLIVSWATPFSEHIQVRIYKYTCAQGCDSSTRAEIKAARKQAV